MKTGVRAERSETAPAAAGLRKGEAKSESIFAKRVWPRIRSKHPPRGDCGRACENYREKNSEKRRLLRIPLRNGAAQSDAPELTATNSQTIDQLFTFHCYTTLGRRSKWVLAWR
jgi:hypothetical protein